MDRTTSHEPFDCFKVQRREENEPERDDNLALCLILVKDNFVFIIVGNLDKTFFRISIKLSQNATTYVVNISSRRFTP
jgi:hypothetical protein